MIYDMIYDMAWHDMIYYMILYIIWYDIYDMTYDMIFNCNSVDTRWQQYSKQLHINNTQNRIHITIKQYKTNWEVLAMPCLCQLYPGISLTAEEKGRKPLSYGSSTYITSRHSAIQLW
jgi:hypothetical protein